MKKFAVILNGCGHLDGSEIHESVMTLLAIDRNDCSYTVFAPDLPQYHVMNHLTRQPMEGSRNMMGIHDTCRYGQLGQIPLL